MNIEKVFAEFPLLSSENIVLKKIEELIYQNYLQSMIMKKSLTIVG